MVVEKNLRNGALLIDIEGLSLDQQDRSLLVDPRVSGVIFFARNFQSVPQMLELVSSIRAVRPELILCVDQEGGRVQRFKSGMTRLPSFSRLAETGVDACEDLAWLMAKEILSLGIDLSFTPVLDIDYGHNTVIGDRSFGSNKEAVIRCASAYLRGLKRAGMVASGKHFPGHGWVDLDSHVALPVDGRAFEEIQDSDMAVFKALHMHLETMMTAHILYPKFDDKVATYSKKWLSLLRDEIGFKGAIVSDDLAMAGATGIQSVCERAESALTAGCDLLLMCNNRPAVNELLASTQQWCTQYDVQRLKGAVSSEDLTQNEEYCRVQRRWDVLLQGC